VPNPAFCALPELHRGPDNSAACGLAALSRFTPVPGQRQGPRPPVLSGQPIEAYSDTELLTLARWITTDDALRTEDERLQEMMRELGFQRRGKNVIARLATAIRRLR
jgi:hypothetical protein